LGGCAVHVRLAESSTNFGPTVELDVQIQVPPNSSTEWDAYE